MDVDRSNVDKTLFQFQTNGKKASKKVTVLHRMKILAYISSDPESTANLEDIYGVISEFWDVDGYNAELRSKVRCHTL